MSYIVLARKYRPQTFAEVYAQEHVTDILQNAIRTNRVSHAFLFTGPRGVGKTSMARILAKSLNCVEGPTVTPCNKCHNCLEITSSTSADVIEIDGASNNGVDNIRDLQGELMYAPTASKYKIYIIDEVHMLSTSAFNALLKTLEEPPENVIFIFATTEPSKVLPTIISRCQRYDFKRIPIEAIVARIKELVQDENIDIDNESIYLIARKADGGLRDALSLLDQVLSYCLDKITVEKVREIFGVLPSQVFANIFGSIHERDARKIIEELHSIFEQGTELQELITNMLDFLRIVLLRKLGVAPSDVNPDEFSLYDEIAGIFSQNELMYIMTYLVQTKLDAKASSNPQLILEVVLIKLCRMAEMDELSSIIAKLDSIKTAPVSQISPKPIVQTPVQSVSANRKPPEEAPPLPQEETLETPDFNFESVQANWQRLVARLKRHSNMAALALNNATVAEVRDNLLKLTAGTVTYGETISKYQEQILSSIEDIFGKKVRLEIVQPVMVAPIAVEIKKQSVTDVSSGNPDVASFIELTKSKILTH